MSHPAARRRALTALALFIPTLVAGAQWRALASPTGAELRGLSVVSRQVVWASGMRGTVVRTTDGGETWERYTVPGASTLDFRAIAATSRDVAHVLSIGDSSLITMIRFVSHPAARRRALTTLALFVPTLVAGAQWRALASPTEVELRGLSVVSPQVVWASGMRGTVVRTTDGGETWDRYTVPGASALDFRAIAVTSRDVAHVLSIGDSSRIYRTTDGGRNWSLRFTSTRKGSFFDAIQFWDAKHGIAMSDPVDGHFLIITTDDGGDTWREMPAAGMPPALKGEGGFAASGTCLIVTGDSNAWLVSGGASVARVYHSSDRGRTWAVHDTPLRAGVASAGIFSVAFRDAHHGVITGGDYQQPTLRGRNLAVSNDGGVTWTLADSASSPSGYRSAVAFVPNTKGGMLVAVGLSGTDVSHDGGTTWALVDSVAYNSVAFAADGRGWAVGPKGRIARWSPR